MENGEVRKNVWTNFKKFYIPKNMLKNIIQDAIRKVTSIPIENIRALQAKNYSNNLAFVTTFNSNNKNVFPLIQTALSPYNTHMKQKNVSKILS